MELKLQEIEQNFSSVSNGGEITLLKNYWHDGIALIKFSNPEKKNAISGKMTIELRNCLNELENWKCGKAVLLYADGDNFCSGSDLTYARHNNSENDGFNLSFFMANNLSRLNNLPMLTVAIVHGATLGGGCEIAVACDFILVSENVKFGLVQGVMGIITAWGGTQRLVRKIGETKSLELLVSSKILNAEECLNVGLATKILNNENRIEQSLEWIKSLTKSHYSVIQAYKKSVNLASRNLNELIEEERKLFVPLWGARPHLEALDKHINHIHNNNNGN